MPRQSTPSLGSILGGLPSVDLSYPEPYPTTSFGTSVGRMPTVDLGQSYPSPSLGTTFGQMPAVDLGQTSRPYPTTTFGDLFGRMPTADLGQTDQDLPIQEFSLRQWPTLEGTPSKVRKITVEPAPEPPSKVKAVTVEKTELAPSKIKAVTVEKVPTPQVPAQAQPSKVKRVTVEQAAPEPPESMWSAGRPGLIEPGNINLFKQPKVKNKDGTVSTVLSMSFQDWKGREVLIPKVTPDGKILTDAEAIAEYRKTGRHLGIFDNPANATDYAKKLHEDYAAGLYEPSRYESKKPEAATTKAPGLPASAAAAGGAGEPVTGPLPKPKYDKFGHPVSPRVALGPEATGAGKPLSPGLRIPALGKNAGTVPDQAGIPLYEVAPTPSGLPASAARAGGAGEPITRPPVPPLPASAAGGAGEPVTGLRIPALKKDAGTIPDQAGFPLYERTEGGAYVPVRYAHGANVGRDLRPATVLEATKDSREMDSYPGRIAQGVAGGFISSLESGAALGNMVGVIPDEVLKEAQRLSAATVPEAFQKPIDWADPKWWLYSGGQTIASIASLALAAEVPSTWAGAFAERMALSKGSTAFLRNVLGPSGVAAASEALFEGGSAYSQAIQQGATKEEAADAAMLTTIENVPFIFLTDLSAFNPVTRSRIINSATQFLTQGAQEYGQQIISQGAARTAYGSQTPLTEGALEAGVLGGITGIGFANLHAPPKIAEKTLTKLQTELVASVRRGEMPAELATALYARVLQMAEGHAQTETKTQTRESDVEEPLTREPDEPITPTAPAGAEAEPPLSDEAYQRAVTDMRATGFATPQGIAQSTDASPRQAQDALARMAQEGLVSRLGGVWRAVPENEVPTPKPAAPAATAEEETATAGEGETTPPTPPKPAGEVDPQKYQTALAHVQEGEPVSKWGLSETMRLGTTEAENIFAKLQADGAIVPTSDPRFFVAPAREGQTTRDATQLYDEAIDHARVSKEVTAGGLMRDLGVTEPTAHSLLAEMRNDGIVESGARLGTFVFNAERTKELGHPTEATVDPKRYQAALDYLAHPGALIDQHILSNRLNLNLPIATAIMDRLKDEGRVVPANASETVWKAAPIPKPSTGETTEPETHKFASTQVNLPADDAEAVRTLGDTLIPSGALHGDGRETAPHITVKYGLKTDDVEKVRAVLKNEKPITVTLGATSVFPNGKDNNGDVVKIDVDSADLHRLNKLIAEALPHEDTHPDYTPHITLAYVQPGAGRRFAGNENLKGREITLNSLTFVTRDGQTHEIPLTGTGDGRAAQDATGRAALTATARRIIEQATHMAVAERGGTPANEDLWLEFGPDNRRVTLERMKGDPVTGLHQQGNVVSVDAGRYTYHFRVPDGVRIGAGKAEGPAATGAPGKTDEEKKAEKRAALAKKLMEQAEARRKAREAAAAAERKPEEGPREQVNVESIQRIFGVSEDQAVAVNALLDSVGGDLKAKLLLTQGGTPGASALPQYAGLSTMLHSAEVKASLATAQAMAAAGKSAEDIRLATGWFVGPHDGHLRFETDDRSIQITPAFAALQESKIFDKTQRNEMLLGDAIDAPELFKLYPQLKDYKLIRQPGFLDIWGGLQGWFDDKTNTINITPYAQDPRGTLIHEIQHAIQEIEGFDPGGNQKEAVEKAPLWALLQIASKIKEKSAQEIERLNDIIGERYEQRILDWASRLSGVETSKIETLIFRAYDAKKAYEAGLNQYYAKGEVASSYGRTEEGKALNQAAQDLEDEVRRTIGPRMSDLADQFVEGGNIAQTVHRAVEARKFYEKELKIAQEDVAAIDSGDRTRIEQVVKKRNAGHELYTRISGEIEARDVDARKDMTPEQRAAARPFSSENIRPEDIIRIARTAGASPSVLYQSGPDNLPKLSRWYYSNIGKALETWQAKGTPDQLLKHLGKFKGAMEEAQWTGLNEWLEGRKSVTRSEVRDHIDRQQIHVHEVMRGGPANAEDPAVQEAKKVLESYGFSIVESDDPAEQGQITLALNDFTEDGEEELRQFTDDDFNELDATANEAWETVVNAEVLLKNTKYEGHQLPGGENYREILLTLPNRNQARRDSELKTLLARRDEVHSAVVDALAATWAAGTGLDDVVELQHQRDEIDDEIANFRKGRTQDFIGTHWDEPNVLAHMRVNDRTLDGKRTLYVEEFQSDWARQGREHGFIPADPREQIPYGSVPRAPFIDSGNWADLAMKRIVAYAAEHGYEQVAWSNGKIQQERYDLTKEVDAIAWAPTARYDDRTHVTIHLKSGDILGLDVYNTREPEAGFVNTSGIIAHTSAKKYDRLMLNKPLSEVVGKGLAEKILGASDGELEGEGLKIGGQWAINLYDKALPKFAEAIGKRHGAKVGRIDLTYTDEKPRYQGPEATAEQLEQIAERAAKEAKDLPPPAWPWPQGRPVRPATPEAVEKDRQYVAAVKEFKARKNQIIDLARAASNVRAYVTTGHSFVDAMRSYGNVGGLAEALGGRMVNEATQRIHTLDLPASLRNDVREKGLPLFQGKRASFEVMEDGMGLIRALDNPDVSSVLHEIFHGIEQFLLNPDLSAEERRGITDKDIAAYNKFVGAVDGVWTRETRERGAKAFELYLKEGKAPTKQLQGIFDKFKAWLSEIYAKIQNYFGDDLKLTPEVTALFDRIVTRADRLKAEQAAATTLADKTKADAAAAEHAAQQAADADRAALKVGDRVTVREGTGTLSRFDAGRANVKIALEPDGHLSVWIPLERVTAAKEATPTPAATTTAAPTGDQTEAERRKAEARAKVREKMAGLVKKPDVLYQSQEAEPPDIDQEQVEKMLEILETYEEGGITDFNEVAVMFQEDFATIGDPSQFDDLLELAWMNLKNEEVSVARTLEGAGYEREGRVRDGSGQAPESGGGTAGGDRTGGETVLGGPSAETGETTPGEGAGGTGQGDQGGVVAPGVGGAVDPSQEPVSTSGPSGGTVSGGAISTSGAAADPGPVAADYHLTPERIAVIAGRGNMERARDNIAAMNLIKDLIATKRNATVEEQDVLAKYVGWGATDMAAFLADDPDPDWRGTEKKVWDDIRAATTESERRDLRASSPNAHYTYDLFGPIWDALERAGFKGGRVLEPSVGTGHAFGFMSPDVRSRSRLNAVEKEPLTAAIAAALYPSARVQALPYEKARVSKGTQDLAIGNPPFGDFGVSDARRPDFVTKRIHNYFFDRAMDDVRPGGLVVFITSHGTMDASDATQFRMRMMEKAHFVGAVRLPNTAFDKTAKTKVVTDLIVLQKRLDTETVSRNADLFIKSPERPDLVRRDRYGRETKTYRSSWYDAHPELLLGEESMTGRMRGGEYTLTSKSGDVKADFTRALGQIIPEGLYQPATATPQEETHDPVTGDFKAGEFRVFGNKIVRVQIDGSTVDATPMLKDKYGNATVNKAGVERIKGMVGIRDALRHTRNTMRDADATEEQIKAAQAALLQAYVKFTDEFGLLNAPVNVRLFRPDPESTNLVELEKLKPKVTERTNKNGKRFLRIAQELDRGKDGKGTGLADIFHMRTIRAATEVRNVETPHDALLVSLAQKGYIDWDYMAQVSGRTTAELQEALTKEGRVYVQPDATWVTSDEYLSGDVVSKLADAEAAEVDSPGEFTDNIEALKKVQPTPKTIEDTQIALGAHWVPTREIADYVAASLRVPARDVRVTLESAGGVVSWQVILDGHREADTSHALAVKYGPERNGVKRYVYTFTEAVQDALNLQQPSLQWTEGTGKDRVTIKDPQGTLAARGNVLETRVGWQTYLLDHPEVNQKLVDTFNERFNRTVKRLYDGKHIQETLRRSGLALPFNYYDHQLNGIWRAIVQGNTLLAHEVGAGKTFEGISIAMEWRRLGRARKPMITVPTHLLQQWKRDFIKAYPHAHILAFDDKDLLGEKRQRAMARIAMGDWDAVLVPHSSFGLMNVSTERAVAFLQRMVDEIMAAEAAARAERGDDDPSVKRLESQRMRLQGKIQDRIDEAQGKADNNLVWEDLGVDALIVDEAHAFKNLFMISQIQGIRGINLSESNKAMDMAMKVQDINEQSGNRNLLFLTATPVMNSMTEVFTMQRYLQPQVLREMGLESFDNWFQMFARANMVTEQMPDGSYREVQRANKFQNLKLLSNTLMDVADYVGWRDMPYLDLPKLKDNRITIVETDPHPVYDLLKTWFTQRLDAIRANPPHVKRDGTYVAPARLDPLTGQPTGKLDNILTIMNDAKLAAIDARLVLGNRVADFAGSRAQKVANDVVEYYKKEAAKKGVALIFLDVGTPKDIEPLEFLKDVTIEDTTGGAASTDQEDTDIGDEDTPAYPEDSGFNLYDDLKKKLVKQGIPSREIAYIHQARNSVERLALFDALKRGEVRVLIASTEKGSTGMNIQDLLGATFHVDVPRAMRPGDIRQRDGRMMRQGNTFKEVDARRYITKGTTDEWLYGLLAGKQAAVEALMRGEIDTFDDEDPSTMSLEEAQMRATGDPRGVELTQLRGSLLRLQAQASAAERAVAKARSDLAEVTPRIAAYTTAVARLDDWIKEHHQDLRGDKFVVTLGGADFTIRPQASQELARLAKQYWETKEMAPATLGTIGGVTIEARRSMADASIVWISLSGSAFDKIEAGQFTIAEDGTFVKAVNIASIENAYARIKTVLSEWQNWLASDNEKAQRAQEVLDRPSPTIEKVREAEARIKAIEDELKAEAIAGEIERRQRQPGQGGTGPTAWIASQAQQQQDDSDEGDDSDNIGGDNIGGTAAGTTTRAPRGEAATQGTTPAATVHKEGEIPTVQASNEMRPIELPELYAWFKDLGGITELVKAFRSVGKRGEFRAIGSGQIRLPRAMFTPGNEHILANVFAHEMGHWIDWLPTKWLKRGNLLGRLFTLSEFRKGTFTTPDGRDIKNAKIKAELIAASELWRPWDPKNAPDSMKKYRNSAKELYADALSMLLRNPGLLEKMAPTFYKEFFTALDAKPEVKKAYFEIQDLLSQSREELVRRRLERDKEMFARGEKRAIELQREAANRVDSLSLAQKFRTLLVDINTPLFDIQTADEKRGVVVPEARNMRYFLEENNYIGGKQKGWLEREILPIYEDLLKAGLTTAQFGQFLFNERIAHGDRSDIANPDAVNPAVAAEKITQLEKDLGPEKTAAMRALLGRFRAAGRVILDEMYGAGLITEKQYESASENPYYATWNVIEYMSNQVDWQFKTQHGTLKDITNPFEPTILKLLTSIRAIHRNQMVHSVVNHLRQFHPGDIQNAETYWDKNSETYMPKEPKDKNLGLVTYRDKGKYVGVYVDEYIANAIANKTIAENKMLMTALNLWSGAPLFRPLFTTFNAGFQLVFNPMRDFQRFWKNMPRMSLIKAMKLYAQSVKPAWHRAHGGTTGSEAWDTITRLEEAKILGITYNDLVAGQEEDNVWIEHIFAKSGLPGYGEPVRGKVTQKLQEALGERGQKLLKGVLWFTDWIRTVGDFFETLPKVAGAIHLAGGTGEKLSQMTPVQRSFVRKMVGTPDILAHGSATAASNKVFLYSNAMLQGTTSDWRMLTHSGAKHMPQVGTEPKTMSGVLWKTAAINLLPKLIMWGLMAGFGGDWYRKIMQRGSSEYDRTNYNVVPLWLDDKGNGVVLRIPQDQFGQFLGGLFWKGLRMAVGDTDVKNSLSQIFDYMGGQAPNLSPGIGVWGDVWAKISGRNIYDTFRGREVLSREEADRNDWSAWKKYMEWEFQQLGGSVFWKPPAETAQEKTAAQRVLDLPVISNTLGRLIKIGNYGETEKMQGIVANVRKDEARQRFAENNAIDTKIKEFKALPADQQKPGPDTTARLQQMSHDMIWGMYPDADERMDRGPGMARKFFVGALTSASKANPIIDSLDRAGSNDQRLAVLKAAHDEMNEAEYRAFLDEARNAQVISNLVRAKAMEAAGLKEVRVP